MKAALTALVSLLQLVGRGFAETALERAAADTYDYIFIGGGAVGCPVARTVAEAGKKVLIIERGTSRNHNDVTLDIYGAGLGMTDPRVSQLVVTKNGVRSHIGNGLGGGSGINFAIVIQEQWDYWHYIESLTGCPFQWNKLYEASNWTHDAIAKDVPLTVPYGTRLRAAFEAIFGPDRGSQVQLQLNSSWNGKTLFDPGSNWFRVASDYLLGKANETYPDTLSILLEHTVHRIIFEEGSVPAKKRATCVEVAPTTLADFDTILPGRPRRSLSLLLPLTSVTRSTFNVKKKPNSTHRICVKEGGQIVSSAGALLTPLLLWKSGVGPSAKVKRAGAENLVREIPELGENLRDRLFLPIGMFFNGELTDRSFPPRITQELAITNVGPRCEAKQIWEPTLECSTVPTEELSGARIAEGAIYATRFIASPELRNDPLANLVFQVMQACAEETYPLGAPLLAPLCLIANPAVRCFRKVAAPLSFISEPVAAAEIDVDEDGYFVVDGHYLEHPVDVAAAIRAVSSVLAVIEKADFTNIMQPSGREACPMTILNTFVNLATQLMEEMQNVTNPLQGEPTKTGAAAEELTSSARSQGLAGGNAILLDEAEFDNAEDSNSEGASFVEWVLKVRDSHTKAFVEKEAEKDGQFVETTGSSLSSLPVSQAVLEVFGPKFLQFFQNYQSQKYATYPPTLPDPWDLDGIEQFARAWSTSMWHWTGSASMGQVVDSNFTVKGFENLKIADASVLNRMSRMNPLFSLITLGRYIGLVLAEASSDASESPPGGR